MLFGTFKKWLALHGSADGVNWFGWQIFVKLRYEDRSETLRENKYKVPVMINSNIYTTLRHFFFKSQKIYSSVTWYGKTSLNYAP